MKAIDTLRFGLVLGLTLALGAGSAARAQDEPKKEPAKKQAAKEKEGDKDSGEKLWIVDFDEAKTIAAKEGKAILMEFTGSDWCPPCIALKKKVFDTEAFQTEAPKHFVLLKLDNPNDKSKQTDKEIKQYKRLSRLHKIRGVPTIILADAQGRPFAQQVGYGGTEAKEFTKGLTDKTAMLKARDSLLSQAKAAQGVERAKLLEEALGVVGDELALPGHRDLVDEIIKLDSENKAGLKSKYEPAVKKMDLQADLAALQEDAGDDRADLVKKIDSFVKDKKLTGEALQEALWLKGQNQFRLDREAARKTLEEAVAAAPDSELGKQIKEIVDQVFKDQRKKKDKE